MDTTEHLLTCLNEECSEVQQALSKALRFGMQDGYPNTERTNEGDLITELNDLMAVLTMLEVHQILPKDWNSAKAQEMKISKVRHFMAYSRNKGTLK